ncbi:MULTISPECIES: biotin carboxylase N-terminal domain-containing protein [unclassified Chelatococcus]|uniref:acetyl/propionyl/methylcrotonyl-CoA carboxylase subunit alpha n=1 Tax=unclassified Chelatococcus TaxID=2638111 RepID=UPI001BCA6B50|nr:MULTISPECIES: biotin carboxylase N-terminal domain-containing protein [unclassified Chelatococcus]CAH1653032.1 Biotin carboxylase / Biotin carboxyl carrier protein [Hyphomicrobiales bacterium]MBS7742954.1 ATP-grasp domain-containing protein [Chelatococcus sp. HY11]MBX3541928.1 ATP-grasp domain-containing protein [Chelatococcus sp.]MCO5074181.1 ATP-grasp domain-containing protein [Chelatococcus sp.]CAH1694189.1 Biotin carboxylase / Biotin carboxyl carrier protein [Hyphomicrobiales bacterium]
MFSSVLISNRGEIAVRLIRACRTLGLSAVAVYSDADAQALHVRLADRAVRIGEGPARNSYLDTAAIVAAALAEGVVAVHPGYGFLSENPAFAQGVIDAGLTFIGPDPAVIATMADKTAARAAAIAAGLPVLPGSDAGLDVDDAQAVVRTIGYPLLVKAAFGGGGRGMRIVAEEAALAAALESAAREAQASFGKPEVFLERYVEWPRHVEVQVFGDRHGHVIHLGDRDCSMQRRHQKVIEEAPAPDLPPDLRHALHAAAVQLARSVGYVGAGTVEFLVDAARENFYFLEMNTRLQVEHGVTELVTGLDLVELQLLVAAGRPLPFTQADVVLRGHAIEARVAAEDPAAGFAPSAGRIGRLDLPAGPWVRTDFGFGPGDAVPPFYDSMLGKVLAWGSGRAEAARRLSGALAETRIEGVASNCTFLRRVVDSDAFAQVDIDVGWIEREAGNLTPAIATGAVDAVVPDGEDGIKAMPFRREVLDTPQGQVVLDIFTGQATRDVRAERERRGTPATISGVQAAKPGPVAPIDATVVNIAVAVGDVVTGSTVLAVVEAMKMEMPVLAGIDGIVTALHVAAGETIKAGALVCAIQQSADT